MNKYGKKLLSVLLVMAMMASLLVVPAGAAEVTTTTTYNFQSDEFRACGVTSETAGGDFTWTTTDSDVVTGTKAFIQGNNAYGVLLNNGGTLTIPVEGNCDITATFRQRSNLKLGEQSLVASNSGTEESVTIHYADWQEGDTSVTLTSTGGQSYILSIVVSPLTTAPEMKLDKNSVVLKLDETAEVTPTVTNGTAGAYIFEYADDGIVTAAEADGTITLTPTAAGKTTVTVKTTVDETELTDTVIVRVLPAEVGAVAGNQTITFRGKTGVAQEDIIYTAGLEWITAMDTSNGEGPNAKSPALNVYIPDGKQTTLTIDVCGFVGGQSAALTANGETVTPTDGSMSENGTNKIFTVENASGKVELVFTSSSAIFIHSIAVGALTDVGGGGEEPTPPVVSGDKRIGVWDIAGKAETDTSLYTNHITPETWAAYAATQTGDAANYLKNGEFPGQTVTLDGLTITAATPSSYQCSLFSTVTGAWGGVTPKTGSLVTTFEDGYTSAGGYMAYGGGTTTRRYITIAGVKAGETVVAYLGNNQKDTTYVVDGVDATLTVKSREYGILTFIAPKDGDYKIYEPANTGKPAYLRVMVVPPVTVSGSIELPSAFDATGWGLKFVDPDTKAETVATVNNDGTYTVELAPGHTYNASLTGANGWGMTAATKSVAPVKTDITTGKTHDLAVEAKSQYTYSGTITGFAAGYDTSKVVITLIPDADSKANAGAEDVDLTLSGMNFTAVLDPSVKYTLELKGANDYIIKTPDEVTSEGVDLTGQSIVVETKTLVAASGKFVVLDTDDQFAPLKANSTYEALTATVTKLTFKNVDDDYTYDATIADGGYTANLRAGAYEAVATVDGYVTRGHVVVGDKAVSKDLLFVSTATPAAVDYAADVYVDGKGGSDLHFKTVTGAMAYIRRMTRTDVQRVTVHIAPGTYREQISIDSKNVTFVNDTPSKEVKLTWYYGIGYTYYSATGKSSTDSWYDAELAFDRYSKPAINVARWGCTVRVQAPGFQADGITFENSFNRELVDEEIVDGAEPNGTEAIRVVREYGLDVTSRAATERAAVLWVDTNNGRGDTCEFRNCKFLSSQDTLVTGKRMYFKDCYIEGMTDYICGPGDVVFDTCTLNWKGYSESAQGGYVTAPQTTGSETGYLFRNCYISGDTKLQLGAGALGRTWGCSDTGCIFLNTTIQDAGVLTNATWVLMLNVNAYPNFNSLDQLTKVKEWGTALSDGTKVDLSKRAQQNTVATSEPAVDVKGTYFKDWDPEYYTEEAQGVALAAAPTVSDNGDINLPHPGHTLTVGYTLTPAANNANDASTIQWYRVAADGAETLVKTSSATAGKTYQIQEADVGAHIKVTVTPKTIGGQTGDAMSYTVAEAVQAGYDDPSGVVDPVLGAGVNVYLAGDSTVKDYSAAGMWNKGVLQGEGSWGEWLQQFFNDKVTIVNYAQGGRTTRSFIEQDGSLDKIDATMKEGDFLFIQFGHNDSHTADDRGVPLGIAKNDPQKSYAEGGVYPDVSLEANTYYPAGTKTYTAYLKDYIAVTEKHGATAVLMTPVARLYYTNGKIRPHHDATAFDGTNDNEYCKAVKWVYDWAVDQGYNVIFIDNYQLTADLFEKAYADGGNDTYGRQLMHTGDSTHNSKLGGLIEAAIIAQAIQDSDLTISKAVKAPTQIQGKTPDGETAFTITGAGAFSAYDNLTGFVDHATYWEGKGQEMFDDIAAKAAELNGGSTTPDDPDNPDNPDDPSKPDTKALTDAIKAAKAEAANVSVSEDGSDVSTKSKWVPQTVMDTYENAIKTAETVAAKQDATQVEVEAAKTALDAATATFQAAQADGTKKSHNTGSPVGTTTKPVTPVGTTTTVNPDGTVATTTTDKDGNVDITVKGEDGEVLAEVKLPATVAAPSTRFVDVPDDHWAAASINNMAGLGMVKGVREDTYDMVSPMTRGSIATIFHRLSNGAEGKTASFADVAAGAWYADAIGWAAATGVVNGYSETAFGPDDTITRQQLAVMIARYARLLGLDTTAEEGALASFSDGSAAGDWAVDSLAWCVKNGVMKGRGGDVLDPTAAVTRAEAAVMLDRMIGLIK